MTSPFTIAIALAIGAVAGTVMGMLGLGGGSIITPALSLILGMEQHVAQSISLGALLPPVGYPSLRTYMKNGVRVRWGVVALLICGFVVGAALGGWGAHRIPEPHLRYAFAGMLIITAVRAVMSGGAKDGPNDREPIPFLAAPIGFLGGILSGLFGLGGGLVVVPLLRTAARFGRLEAQALSLAMMLPPIGLPALFVYAREQHGLAWSMVAAVAIGFSLGGIVGGRLALRVPARTAARVFAAVLVLSSVLLVTRH